MADRNFDTLAERFSKNIYDSPKGEIRLRLVQEELLAVCPQLSEGKRLRILDVGCGMGQMTALLLKLGHEVVACDVSASMIEQTRTRIESDQPDLLKNLQLIQSPLQDLSPHIQGQFDLIIFHAVLEWLENPRDSLETLLPWLKHDGVLSLLFYNINSLIFKNLLRGNFKKIEDASFRGDPGSLTPLNPLDPVDVERWLLESKLSVYSKRGIRTFYDFMNETMRHEKPTLPIEDIIKMERQYGIIEPYRSLGRYMLLHCKKPA
jgi:S-adenosylmethionine-dependent methyltransferase